MLRLAFCALFLVAGCCSLIVATEAPSLPSGHRSPSILKSSGALSFLNKSETATQSKSSPPPVISSTNFEIVPHVQLTSPLLIDKSISEQKLYGDILKNETNSNE